MFYWDKSRIFVPMKKVFIYGLINPITKQVKYIGKTHKFIEKRLSEHLEPKRLIAKTYKNYWIKSLIKEGLKPEVILIKEVEQDNWQFWEEYYISQYNNLTNGTKGGDGLNKPTQEVKDKIGKANSKKVIQYDLDGNFIKIWDSMSQACDYFGLKTHGPVSSAANPNNRKKTSCGFQWKKYTENYKLKIEKHIPYRKGSLIKTNKYE